MLKRFIQFLLENWYEHCEKLFCQILILHESWWGLCAEKWWWNALDDYNFDSFNVFEDHNGIISEKATGFKSSVKKTTNNLCSENEFSSIKTSIREQGKVGVLLVRMC